MVLALLSSGMAWNLSTWWLGLPVSSSHTLIGAILGIGIANSFLTGQGVLEGVNWAKAGEVGLAFLISPLIGFASATILLLTSKRWIRDPQLYVPPPAAGLDSHDPALDLRRCRPGARIQRRPEGHGPDHAGSDRLGSRHLCAQSQGGFRRPHRSIGRQAAQGRFCLVPHSSVPPETLHELDTLIETLDGKTSLREVPLQERWRVRSTIFQLGLLLQKQRPARPEPGGSELDRPRQELREAIEYVPTWVVVGVALCLGIGTTIGYKRIVVTVAEKIGKTHLTTPRGPVPSLSPWRPSDRRRRRPSRQHDPRSLHGGRRHHVGQQVGHPDDNDSQDRPRLDPYPPRRDAARGSALPLRSPRCRPLIRSRQDSC